MSLSKLTDQIKTDVLVIGSGIAGATTALVLAEAGVPVTVVTRTSDPHESNTYYAQGGIIYQGENDSAQLLSEDIIRAGAGCSQPEAVAILAEQGPPLVEQILLELAGVPFDRDRDCHLSLAREGGHSLSRVIHAADATGRAISIALLKALARRPQVTLLSEHTAADLLTTDRSHSEKQTDPFSPGCGGAYLLNRSTGQVISCLAKKTVLATGGLGQVFMRTTNPAGARGDGVAMAYRMGAQVSHMEFVQFHPTAFYRPPADPFLISEAVRGAGAKLVDAGGRPFMQRYAPEWKDLAPRHIVAQSIHQEMMIQGLPNVYLDLGSYIPKQEILSHFPNIYEYCLGYGVDITRDLVPVVPAAHYACGGVDVDAWGRTSVEHLYAVGEVAQTGVHGANRLASTSLLEGLVWGHRAATDLQNHLNGRPGPDPVPNLFPPGRPAQPAPDSTEIDRYSAAIKKLMWEYVGLTRARPGLTYVRDELHYLQMKIETLYQAHRPTDDLIGLRNMVQVARLITTAALENKVAVGCHYLTTAAE